MKTDRELGRTGVNVIGDEMRRGHVERKGDDDWVMACTKLVVVTLFTTVGRERPARTRYLLGDDHQEHPV